jgi:predicted RNA-binding protein with PIN domain
MHYLIDAYNLMFRRLKKRGVLEKNRQQLIAELNDAISELHMHVTLVFDGADKDQHYPSRGHFDAIEIVYTSKTQTADEYIDHEVACSKSPTQMTVVTNDRELSNRCRLKRAKTCTIDQFLALVLKKKARRKRQTSPRTPREFKDSDPELARLLSIFEKRLLEEP